jgi:hypothetical protein
MTTTTSSSELNESSPQTLIAALDYGRFDAIAEFAERAASYLHAVALAANRGERLTIEVHCRQVAVVIRECFATVKTLGSQEAEQ